VTDSTHKDPAKVLFDYPTYVRVLRLTILDYLWRNADYFVILLACHDFVPWI
jgi:hypothetical protein